MQNHVLVMFYILSAFLGFFTIAVSLSGIIRSKIKQYWLLFSFYTAFTLMICLMFIREYLEVNRISDSIFVSFVLQGTNLFFNFIFMTSVALFFQRLMIQKKQNKLSLIILLFNIFVYFLFFLSGMKEVNMRTGEMDQTLFLQTASVLHLFVFIFLILIGILGSKKDRAARELVLIWSLIVFALFGFVENLISFINQVYIHKNGVISINQSFLISSIPYIIFSAILIYYFGSYILADLQPKKTINKDFAEAYKLTTRELEVIPLINRGMNNREIAEKLYLSTATIKTHIHNIYTKTNTKSRYELFHIIQKHS